jgi:hypothetical protein
MTMIATAAARVKATRLHPYAPARRERRPFAEGLLDDEPAAPVNRVAAHLTPSASPVDVAASIVEILPYAGTVDQRYIGRTLEARGFCRELVGVVLHRLVTEGRVERFNLDGGPGYRRPAPKPAPRHARGPSLEDVAFEMGRSAALEGRHGDVAPPKGLTDAERSAFVAGVAAGLAEVERAEVEDFDAMEMEVDWQARAEAGLMPLRAVAMD